MCIHTVLYKQSTQHNSLTSKHSFGRLLLLTLAYFKLVTYTVVLGGLFMEGRSIPCLSDGRQSCVFVKQIESQVGLG